MEQTIDGMTVTSEDGHTFTVLSTSGNVYTVTYRGSGDGDPEHVALWGCNCPAGQHGRECKHVRAAARFCSEQ
jgi:hypothetical protein